MNQQTPARAYKMKPMSAEVQKKVALSYTESLDLEERELHCPHCGRYVMTLFADASGHFKSRCKNCKVETIYNLGYFRRRTRRGQYRKYH